MTNTQISLPHNSQTCGICKINFKTNFLHYSKDKNINLRPDHLHTSTDLVLLKVLKKKHNNDPDCYVQHVKNNCRETTPLCPFKKLC